DALVLRQNGHELLELAVLLFELLQAPDLGHGSLTVAVTLDNMRRFANPELTWDFWHRLASHL
ncbi:MAG: hypothetical protein ABIO96_07335, partial [Nitrospiraceae bacterium]